MALCPNRFAGTAYVKVDSEQFALRGDLTISIDPFERTGVAGLDGVHGYTEAPRVPFIEGTFSDIRGLSLTRLQQMCDVTVTAEMVNGKTYLLSQAWTATARELNAVEGSVSIRWEGITGTEIMP
jgi:hypothetical protein